MIMTKYISSTKRYLKNSRMRMQIPCRESQLRAENARVYKKEKLTA